MARRIAFINEKGGTGKTTLVLNIGDYIARQGKKVLLVDMDPQGHIGKSLGVDVQCARYSVFDLLIEKDLSVKEAVLPTNNENLKIVVANKLLTDLTINIAKDSDRHVKLKQKLDEVEGFDFILIDSPPSLGLLTVNILLASDEIIIPVSMTYLALDGCAEIISSINLVRKNFNHDTIHISKVIPTLYRDTALSNAILNRLRGHFGEKLSKTVLKFDDKIDQSQSFGKTIFEFAPNSEGAQLLANLGNEVMNL
jgi:chromosome partitioning protein